MNSAAKPVMRMAIYHQKIAGRPYQKKPLLELLSMLRHAIQKMNRERKKEPTRQWADAAIKVQELRYELIRRGKPDPFTWHKWTKPTKS